MSENEGFGEGHNSEEAVTLDRQVEAASEHIETIEAEQAKIDEIMDKAKKECASHRDTISEQKKKCRDDFSIEAKSLGTILTKRRQERRMAARIEALPEAAREQYDMFEEKLSASE